MSIFKDMDFLKAMYMVICLGGFGPATASDVSGQTAKAALVIVDVQDCFLSGGSLAVTGANEVVAPINEIRTKFRSKLSAVVVSQDWHCPQHISFAATHPGKSDYEIVQLSYKEDGTLCFNNTVNSTNFPNAVDCRGESKVTIEQTLWPVHCVVNVSAGATSSGLDSNLLTDQDDILIRKGTSCEIDSYSLFYDNGDLQSTGLEHTLQDAGITVLFVTGVALDYCVYNTALDGRELGFDVYLVLDATRGVAEATSENAKEDMAAKGIKVIQSSEVGDILDSIMNNGLTVKCVQNDSYTVKPILLVYAVMFWQLLI